MKVEAFVIHLERAHDRTSQVGRVKNSLPMPVTVIGAVDGQGLSQEEISAVYRPALHRPRYPFRLRPSEIACFLSHRKAWSAIIERGLDAGLVIEDDVEIDGDRFAAVLDLALARARRGDLVRFPKKARGEARQMAAAHAARLVAPRHPGLGMQAQLVGRGAAEALMAFTRTFDRPVDTTAQMRWLHGIRVLEAAPVAIREVAADLGGTTVQGKSKPLSEILTREFRRTVYRVSAHACNVLLAPGTKPL